jgi:hypothetical protein
LPWFEAAPDRRHRGTSPHLSYSIARPFVGAFVTHVVQPENTGTSCPQGGDAQRAFR